MYNSHTSITDIAPSETVDYLRKSQSDDPLMTVEEVLARHERLLDEWSRRNLGGTAPEENKFREIVSGETIASRPEIKRVLALIESPRIKAIKVVEPQRLTRGDLEDIGRLMKLLKLTKTLVITPERTYDLTDDYDWDIFERELKRGNDYLNYYKKIQRRGKLISVSSGNFLGSRAPYGYKKSAVIVDGRRCPTLIPSEEAPVVRMIFELYTEKGLQPGEICTLLDGLGIKPPRGGNWAKSAVHDMLTNVHYIGKVSWNRRRHVTTVEDSELVTRRPIAAKEEILIFDGRHEALITEEMFAAAAEKRERSPKHAERKRLQNPLSGLLYCECGSPMKLEAARSGGEARYACRRQKGSCDRASCGAKELQTALAEALTEAIVDAELDEGAAAESLGAERAALIEGIKARIAALKEREERQWAAYSSEDPAMRMPEAIFRRLNERTLRELDDANTALAEAIAMQCDDGFDGSKKAAHSSLHSAIRAITDDTLSAELRNRLLLACVDRVTYSRKREMGGSVRGARYAKLTSPIELDVRLRI